MSRLINKRYLEKVFVLIVLGLGFLVGKQASAALEVENLNPVEGESVEQIMPVSLELTPSANEGIMEITTPNLQLEEISMGLTALPPRLGDEYDLIVKPGETVTTSVEVRNPNSAPMVVESFVQDFYIGEDGKTPVGVSGDQANPRWMLSEWVSLTPTASVIEPQGSSVIEVTISVPMEALPGGRYAMILHRPAAGEANGETTGAQIDVNVGTLLYLIVDGPLQEEASISNLSLGFVHEKGPIPYTLTVHNDSSFHIRPNLTLTIENMFGKKIGEIKLEQNNIFPDSERTLTGEWEKSWGFGYYRARVEGDDGATFSTPKQLAMEASFWIIPYKIIALVTVGIIVIVLIVIASRRRYRKLLEIEEEKVRRLDAKLKAAQGKREASTSESGEEIEV
jgi:hypothetical protein